MAKDEEEKGFKVTDKRHFAEPGTRAEDKGKTDDDLGTKEDEKPKEKADKKERTSSDEQIPLPEMNFPTFIFSLNSSALFHLGEIPDPVTNEREKNLQLAKQTIDIIAMLKEKTAGNLTDDEQTFMSNILYDLRIRYVEAMKKA